MSIPSTDHDATADTGEGAFSIRIGQRLVSADRNDELLAAVIGDEYLEEDDPELLFLVRLEQAVMIATAVQESIVAAAVAAGDLDETTDEAVWTGLLAERESADPGVRWEHKVPLVLVTSLFAPYTDRDKPLGNVAWLDPIDDIAMLDSLQGLGVIEIVEHADLVIS
ncbi:MAG TPA: hypothetical protein VK053_10330 [Jiangellaceae bacterium]|nr:hypothetical protein [Jiangellaceae bacterium]